LLALYGLALLAKESAIVLPALLVAGDAAIGRLRLERDSLARYVRATGVTIVLLALVAAAYLALRVVVLGSVAGQDAAPSLPFLRTGQRLFVALQTWPEYLRLLVFPLDLSADYSPDVIMPAAGVTPAVLLGALLLLGTIVLAVRTFVAKDSGRIAGFAAAWFLIAILPVSNLIVPIGVVLAERVLYVPSFALAIVVAHAAARWIALPAPPSSDVHVETTVARKPFAMTAQGTIPAPAFAVIVAIVLLGIRTVLRNPDWRDTPAYWNALVRDHPESYRAQWGVASHMIVNGQPEQGLKYMETAAATWPHDPYLLTELGGQYLERGEAKRALEILERARELGHEGGRVPLYLGLASLGIGRYDAALDWAAVAITSADTLSPGDAASAHALRAQALEGLGRAAEAASTWQTAIQASPGRSFTYWMMLARAHGRTGDALRATAAADTARILAPDAEAVARVDRLTTWIATACWTESGEAMKRDRCEDPLEDWTLVTPNRAIRVKREGTAP
jgi:tetratricopeptide (TPR) repeat protein